MSLADKLEMVNISDTGRKRPHNEDSSIADPELGLAVIADGMGGYKAGEIASAMAVMTVLETVRNGIGRLRPANGRQESGPLHPEAWQLLAEAVQKANGAIFQAAGRLEECQGMGTTVVSTLLYDDHIIVAHAGDSRIYRYRDGRLEQLTIDHSLLQELIDRGFYTPEEAEENTPKNLVTRALGIDPEVKVDLGEHEVQPGDIYLLCSDGLNDMVTDEEILLTLSKYCANLVETAEHLVQLANQHGGKDNISVILIRPHEAFPAGRGVLAGLRKLLGR